MTSSGILQKIHFPAVMAEFVATTLFLFLTMIAVVAASSTVTSNWVAIALAFGGAVTILIVVFTHHSGAHMNPAVTIGLWVTKRLDSPTAGAYIVAQMAGGVLGSYLALFALPAQATLARGAVAVTREVSVVAALLVETLLTFLLVTVIFATSVDRRNDRRFAPIAIGLTVLVAVLAGGPLTGAALNPARWFGPALVEGTWAHLHIYIAGPVLGAMLGALAYTQFLLPKDQAELEALEPVKHLDEEE